MNVLIRSCNGINQVPLDSKLLSDRKVLIEGEITEDMAVEFTKKMLHLNSESDEPITCLINSPGGEINSGLLMYDVIVGSKAPVQMVCIGKAYSMGAILFTCANERLMLPNSELMLHQPLLGGRLSGNASSIKSISDSLLETKEKLNRLISVHTGKSEAEIDEATGFDHYYTPKEAIDFNLADRVISFAEIMEE